MTKPVCERMCQEKKAWRGMEGDHAAVHRSILRCRCDQPKIVPVEGYGWISDRCGRGGLVDRRWRWSESTPLDLYRGVIDNVASYLISTNILLFGKLQLCNNKQTCLPFLQGK